MYRCKSWVLVMLFVLGTLPASAAIGDGRHVISPLDQGGDSCADARIIHCLPFCDRGTTVGAVDNFTPSCVSASTAPDVVYEYRPVVDEIVSISLCGSSYNTVLHVWRGCPTSGTEVCCNDNYCTTRSCCAAETLFAGNRYFFVVDGGDFGTTSGEYIINVANSFECPTDTCSADSCTYPSRDLEAVNDSCNSLLPIVECDSYYCGEIESTSDEDWYRFRMWECGMVYFRVYGNDTRDFYPYGLCLDPRIEIYASDCETLLDWDFNGGDGNDAALLDSCLEKGLYYIRIIGDSSTSGPYVFAISCYEDSMCCDSCFWCLDTDYTESELCSDYHDNYNGGCGPGTGEIAPFILTCSDDSNTVCGSLHTGHDSIPADQDWYWVYVTGIPILREITWCVESDLPVNIGILRPGPGADPCDGVDTLECLKGEPCHSVCVSACVMPGEYLVYVRTGPADRIRCGEYIGEISCGLCFGGGIHTADSLVIIYPHGSYPGSIVLSWSASQDATEYRIYRSLDPDLIVNDANYLGSTTTTLFPDTQDLDLVNPGATYYYQVVAYHRIDASCPSE